MAIHKESKNYSRFCHSEETIIKISMNILLDISLFYIHMLIYAYFLYQQSTTIHTLISFTCSQYWTSFHVNTFINSHHF